MKHSLKFIALLGLLFLGAGSWQARARWSATVTIKNNVVRTGQIALIVNPAEAWWSYDGLLPGETMSRSITLTNSGTVPARLYLTAKKSAGYAVVFNLIATTVSRPDGTIVWSGPLSDLTAIPLTEQLASGQTQELIIAGTLPADADSDARDSYTNITFEVIAEQI